MSQSFCISRNSPHHTIEVVLISNYHNKLRNSRHPRSYILWTTTPLQITLKSHFLPHYQPSHTMQKLHCAAKIHSWNPEVQARASAHHHGQFQLGCVSSVRTIKRKCYYFRTSLTRSLNLQPVQKSEQQWSEPELDGPKQMLPFHKVEDLELQACL